jgi:hypothetical protein
VKNRFQNLPFICNLQRYITGLERPHEQTILGVAILTIGGAVKVEISRDPQLERRLLSTLKPMKCENLVSKFAFFKLGQLVPLRIGTVMAAYGEIAFQWVGVIMMFSSEFSEAFRMAVLQYLMGNLRFELIEGLYIMAPASLAFLTVGIFMFEFKPLAEENGLGKIVANPVGLCTLEAS